MTMLESKENMKRSKVLVVDDLPTNGANNFGISSDIIPIPVSMTDMFTILFIVFACNVIIPLSVNLLY